MVTLANGFAEAGVNVDVVLAKAEGPYLSEVSSRVRLIDLDRARVSRSLPRLIGYLRRERPTTLLSALNHANVVAAVAVALARTRTRIFVSEHNSISQSMAQGGIKKHLLLRAMAYTYARVEKVIGVSTGVTEDLRNALRLPAEKLITIYNPIVTQRLIEKSWENVDAIPSGPMVLAVGRLTKQKDYPTLLRAFRRLSPSGGTRLVILGDGELRDDLTQMVQHLGLAERVLLPGFVENPYAWMRKADLFVLSSAWEGLPTVLVEAIACGAPVVSTDCPSGPSEILEGGRWGDLVPVGDEIALADAIARGLDNAKPAAGRALDFAASIAVERYLRVLL